MRESAAEILRDGFAEFQAFVNPLIAERARLAREPIEFVRVADGALVDAAGRVHARRFAIGPHTNVRVAGAFTRPGTNAQSLRYNDAVARAVLRSLPVVARASSAA